MAGADDYRGRIESSGSHSIFPCHASARRAYDELGKVGTNQFGGLVVSIIFSIVRII